MYHYVHFLQQQQTSRQAFMIRMTEYGAISELKDYITTAHYTVHNKHEGEKNMAPQLMSIETGEMEKGKIEIIVEIIQYIPNAVLSRTIVKKTTGNITLSSFAAGEELAEKTSPFDNFIQIIDGAAQVTINDKSFRLSLGEGIIIPAHAKHCFNAGEQFKMISTVIKSGYED